MPGFLISQSTLTKLPTTRSGDIAIEYTMGVMPPAGTIFAATPQALCDLLKKSGLQSMHSGKFAVKGQMPADVAADLNTARASDIRASRSGIKRTLTHFGAGLYGWQRHPLWQQPRPADRRA